MCFAYGVPWRGKWDGNIQGKKMLNFASLFFFSCIPRLICGDQRGHGVLDILSFSFSFSFYFVDDTGRFGMR